MADLKIERMRELLSSCPKDAFACVKLACQNFVEVCPRFHKDNIRELKNDWFVLSNSGKYHKLKYNRCYGFPQIIEGWEELKKFEGFPNNVEVVFGYYGGRLFSIVAFNEITSLEKIPSFHSRSMLPKETVSFDVVLTKDDVENTKLYIKDDFAEFVREKRFGDLSICTDDGENYAIGVRWSLNSNRAKLGNNWFFICECNNFCGGDVVRFKFGPGDRCCVFKVGKI